MTPDGAYEERSAKALWDNLPDRAPAKAPADLWPAVRARIEGEKIVPLPAREPRWRLAVSFAAGLLVGFALWFLAISGTADPALSAEEILAQEAVFEALDPIPPSSVGGIYFATLTYEEGRR
jgi:hypothetical protein